MSSEKLGVRDGVRSGRRLVANPGAWRGWTLGKLGGGKGGPRKAGPVPTACDGVDPARRRRLPLPRSNWRGGSVLVFGRELCEEISRGVDSVASRADDRRGAKASGGAARCCGCGSAIGCRARRAGWRGIGDAAGCGGGFCGGGGGFSGWGITARGGGVQESFSRGPERGGGLCEFGRDCDAAAAVGASAGNAAEGGAAGAECGGDSFEYWFDLLPAERFSLGDWAVRIGGAGAAGVGAGALFAGALLFFYGALCGCGDGAGSDLGCGIGGLELFVRVGERGEQGGAERRRGTGADAICGIGEGHGGISFVDGEGGIESRGE